MTIIKIYSCKDSDLLKNEAVALFAKQELRYFSPT
jgi:hypothetical protein